MTEVKLKALEDKTKAELARLTAVSGASRFMEQGMPDIFADSDAKLKALEEKTKAELAKRTADSGASSLLEQGKPDNLALLDAKLKPEGAGGEDEGGGGEAYG